jgi:DNA-binding NarL/FixJ family response regulator
MIRVLVVDDHDFVRDSVVAALADAEGIEVIGSCTNGLEAVEQAGIAGPDVVLMDLTMPVLDGVEATRRIVSGRPESRVVILTASCDGRDVDAARAAGAIDSLYKSAEISEVIESIRRAATPPKLGLPPPL